MSVYIDDIMNYYFWLFCSKFVPELNSSLKSQQTARRSTVMSSSHLLRACFFLFRFLFAAMFVLSLSDARRNIRLRDVTVTWSPPGVSATCEQRSTCGPENENVRLPFHARNCFCDVACRLYDDCCSDYTGSRIPPPSSVPTFNCVRVEEIDTSFEYYIVDRCPRDYSANETVRALCHNDFLTDVFYRLPVIGRISGILYRNAYCALCSSDADYVFWRVVHKCSTESVAGFAQQHHADQLLQPEAAIRQLTQCLAELIPPEVEEGQSPLQPRKCKSHVSKCDRRSRGGGRRGRCSGPTAYVYDGLQVYRNEDCAKCNGVEEASCEDGRTPRLELVDLLPTDPQSAVSNTSPPFQQAPHRPAAALPTVTLIIDLNTASGLLHQSLPTSGSGGNVAPTLIELRACDVIGDVFDPYSQSCHSVKFNRVLPAIVRTTITTVTSTMTSAAATTTTSTTTSTTTESTTVTNTTPSTTTVVMTTSSVRVGIRENTRTTMLPTTQFPEEREIDYFETPSWRRATTLRGRRHTTTTTTTVPATTTEIRAFARRRGSDKEVDPSVSGPSSEHYLPPSLIDNDDVIRPDHNGPAMSTVASSRVGRPKCHLLPVSEDHILLANGSLVVMTSLPNQPTVYSSHEYTYINNSLFVCLVPTDDVTSGRHANYPSGGSLPPAYVVMFQLDRIQNLTSLVCVLVSMTSLTACFLVMLCLPALRARSHGRGLVCLIVCLLVGQSLYLLMTLHSYRVFDDCPSDAVTSMCYWVGVISHYLLLATFFWLNVLAMDTTRSAFSCKDTVSQVEAKPPEVDQSGELCFRCARFLAYSIYAWLVPAAIVGGSLAADRLTVDEPLLRAHYGAAGVCWAAGRHGIPLLICLPLAALTAANLVLYTLALAVVGCSDGDEVTRLRSRAMSGLVLTILLASAWTAAMLAVYIELPLLWYAFIGLQAFIGLFTCIAFVVNQTTFGLLRRNKKLYNVGYDDEHGGNDVIGSNGRCGPPPRRGLPEYDEIISQETSI